MAGRKNRILISDFSNLFSSAASHRLGIMVLGLLRVKGGVGHFFWTNTLIVGHSLRPWFSPALFSGLFPLDMLVGLAG